MKVSCEKTKLLEGLQAVHNVASQRGTLPILSHILVEAVKNELKFSATDLEVGIRCSVKAKVSKEGAITVPGRTINDIVKEAPEEEIEISSDDGTKMTIVCGKSIFKIMGLPKEEFPKLPESGGEKSFSMPQRMIKELIKKTAFAVSREETQYALGGVLLHIKKKEITAVATDGRRLAKVKKKRPEAGTVEEEIILPAKAVNEINRIIGDSEDKVKISVGKNEIILELKNIMFMGRFLKGKFPEYENVIPKTYTKRIPLEREVFYSALRRVSLLTSEKSNSVRLNLQTGKMLLTASTVELGEASEEMDVLYDGEDETLIFNPAYLIDFLRNEACEEIYLDIIGPVNPVMLKPKDDEDYVYVVMPIKI